MWRIVRVKTFIAVILLVVGLSLILMSRSSPRLSLDLNAFKSLGSNKAGVELHYYGNFEDKKVDRMPPVVDYPFEDHDTNDFDPGEDDKKVNPPHDKRVNQPIRKPAKAKGGALTDVSCDVNAGKFIINCKKTEDEVYVPFSFLRKYYEVFGKMSDVSPNTFLWSHNPPIKIYRPKQRYDPKGVFAFFDSYNVEVRDRVKCISGSTGVPVSTQWDVNGYYYPIQIAQFGLSHYSKYITEKSPPRVILENGADIRGDWRLEEGHSLKAVPDPDYPTNQVLAIKAVKFSLSLQSVQRHLLVLSVNVRSETQPRQGNVTFTVKVSNDGQNFFLHYVTAEFHIKVEGNNIYHGIGHKSQGRWHHLVRDVGVDLQKGLSFSSGGRSKKNAQKVPRSKVTLESLSIHNLNSFEVPVLIDNLTLSSTEHLSQFFQAVDWFLENQDHHGGWPIPVGRKFHQASKFYPTLSPGWYSAMGQGHGLSLLARAYALTKDKKYAAACERTLKSIFDQSGTDNLGVRAVFMEEYVWFEEYPTSPPSFVLNGFIYSLFGLYDVQALHIPGASEKARKLYQEGMRSLIKMLPLYDTGSGTFYDLRHFTVPGIAPNLARLDYHVTHINQLLILATIHDDPIFETTAARWIQYSQGERAPHN